MVKISLIMAVYNRADILLKALMSIQAQSVKPYEVILSDDGSSEDIAAVIGQYKDRYDFRIRHVYQPDKGFRLAKARNNAIRHAEGDYLVFWDQDVLATRHYLKTFTDHFKENEFLIPPDPVRLTKEQSNRVTDKMIETCDYSSVVTRQQLRELRKRVYKDWYYQFETRFFKRKNGYKPKVRGGILGISKKAVLLVDGYDETYQGWGAEDDDLGRRLYRAGIRGSNVFLHEYPLHLWHSTNKDADKSINLDYYNKRLAEIRKGDVEAVHGLSNPLGDDEVKIIKI
ncbi:MAG TPA: glycosyltransferase [Calditrichaeota bacterium]|nr:glycosyltransferase [Calditrichota bacterium]